MKRMKALLKLVLITIILTIFTQIGGLIYLIYKPIGSKIKRQTENKLKSIFLAYFVLPMGHAPSQEYFKPIGERSLQKDEIGQFNYAFKTLRTRL